MKGRPWRSSTSFISKVTKSILAVHPAHSTTVTYVSGVFSNITHRKDVNAITSKSDFLCAVLTRAVVTQKILSDPALEARNQAVSIIIMNKVVNMNPVPHHSLADSGMQWSRRTSCREQQTVTETQSGIDEATDNRRYKVCGAVIEGCWIPT